MTKPTLILLVILLSACNTPNTRIAIYTGQGEIKAFLYSEKAPVTTANFLKYVENKHFDNTSFYRTVTPNNQPDNDVKIEVIQGGISFHDKANIFAPIKHENTQQTSIKHLNGTLSMARADTGTVTSEFFICINNQPELDYGGRRNPDLQGFAAFGKVFKGMDIVKKIQHLPENGQFFISPVKIDSIRIIQ